jgi:hypothetical protein
MEECRLKSKLVAMMFVSVFSLNGPVPASASPTLNAQVIEAITKVRDARTPMERWEAGMALAELTRNVDSTQLDDSTLESLVSLLDSPQDSQRFWVAASLGNIGPRASMSAPKLLKLLPDVDCVTLRGLNSAAAIRFALEKMGMTPPPRTSK